MYLEGGGREVRREAGMDRKRKGRQRARVGREGKGGGTEGGSKGEGYKGRNNEYQYNGGLPFNLQDFP